MLRLEEEAALGGWLRVDINPTGLDDDAFFFCRKRQCRLCLDRELSVWLTQGFSFPW